MIKNCVYNADTSKIEPHEPQEFSSEQFMHSFFYDKEEFHLYHKQFASKVYRIIVKSSNKFIGYCYTGVKENNIKAPYSSPFSMIYMKIGYKIEDVCTVVGALKKCVKFLKYDKIEFTLPPEIYSPELVNSLSAAFFSDGFKVKLVNVNSHFNLEKYPNKETYLKIVPHRVRKSYKKALKNNLSFSEISIANFKVAYDVININREQMGHPLKISEQQMRDLLNMKALSAKCFVVKKNDICISAAIIFDVTEEISQVVYWGDILEYRAESPMAMLTTEVLDTYKKLGKRYLDIGPSSEDGIINAGLADFKKSIGCDNTIKMTFQYEF